MPIDIDKPSASSTVSLNKTNLQLITWLHYRTQDPKLDLKACIDYYQSLLFTLKESLEHQCLIDAFVYQQQLYFNQPPVLPKRMPQDDFEQMIDQSAISKVVQMLHDPSPTYSHITKEYIVELSNELQGILEELDAIYFIQLKALERQFRFDDSTPPPRLS